MASDLPTTPLTPLSMLSDAQDDSQQVLELPVFMNISSADAEQAANVVQRMYLPETPPATSTALQRDLFELQKRPEAWGLVAPFVGSADPQVQFFGAHTAQVKIARDWDQWPINHVHALRDWLLALTTQAAARGIARVVLRKLYVALSSLALRLCPMEPSLWIDWVKDVTTQLLSVPAPESAPDFLRIAVEEVRSADLLGHAKMRMQASLRVPLPFIMELFLTHIPTRDDIPLSGRLAWLETIEAWVAWSLPGDELTALVPVLINLLHDHDSFLGTCNVLEEIMTKSALADGKGTKILTEPLLEWISNQGYLILQESLNSGVADETSHAFCKLLLAIGEHSSEYIVAHVDEQAVQNYLRTVLGYTAFPGWYGVDEDESEMTLQFWSSLQDTVIDSDFGREDGDLKWETIKALDLELVSVLVRKAKWPSVQEGIQSWAKDQKDKFQNFRRDLGDTLINTYYVLRDTFFDPIVPQIVELLAPGGIPAAGWETVEAAVYAVKAVQEAVPLYPNPYLSVVFGPQILGRLPPQGHEQVRRTALDLVGAYSTWFHELESNELLMSAMQYVVAAFTEPQLSLNAARSLRDLCENNRKALSQHVDAFANLYANLPAIPDTEKAKVLQAICSVLQALPLAEAIGPVEGVVSPLVVALASSLQRAIEFPEQSRTDCVSQLQALSACAKGLTNTTDPIMELSTADEDQEAIRVMEQARIDPRVMQLRQHIVEVLKMTMNIWSADAEVGEALSELIRAITSLPVDNTLLSLPPAPVLELVCAAAQRQTTAVWLSLATMLTSQLAPSSFLSSRTMSEADRAAAQQVIASAAASLTSSTLQFLATPGAMEANPDIVRAFFVYLMAVSNDFTAALLQLPPALSSSLMECAIRGLTLSERYSLVDAAKFLHTFCRRTLSNPDYIPPATEILKVHGPAMARALLSGIAGASPRTTIPNLVELLALLLAKIPEHRTWMKDVLYSAEMNNPRLTREVKDKFYYVATTSRSTRQTCDAANEFSLVARGLEGSSFGYASITL